MARASPLYLMVKPTGALCNLACRYCYYLPKASLYPGSRFRMTDEVLEACVSQMLLQARDGQEVTFAWQGGEPTLMGLDFFRKAIGYQEKYRRPDVTIRNALQTNGTLLNDEWCQFFHAHGFLIGLSLDGPRELHDVYRVDRAGRPTFAVVMRGLAYLQKHQVEFNILTAVHAANVKYPLEVYRFLRDQVGARFIQFIPIVERGRGSGNQQKRASACSVQPDQFGNFLITVFDEWVRRDVGRVYVQQFDVALGAWLGQPGMLCVFAPTCGNFPVMEHNGDVYACDHFVTPEHFLGNIRLTPLTELAALPKQQRFGQAKWDTLPRVCRDCDVLFACYGGCPKDRFVEAPDGESGLNYLCTDYKKFFHHVDQPMRIMANLLSHGMAPAAIMSLLAARG